MEYNTLICGVSIAIKQGLKEIPVNQKMEDI